MAVSIAHLSEKPTDRDHNKQQFAVPAALQPPPYGPSTQERPSIRPVEGIKMKSLTDSLVHLA
jgi:hypothetical protein